MWGEGALLNMVINFGFPTDIRGKSLESIQDRHF